MGVDLETIMVALETTMVVALETMVVALETTMVVEARAVTVTMTASPMVPARFTGEDPSKAMGSPLRDPASPGALAETALGSLQSVTNAAADARGRRWWFIILFCI